MQKVYAELVFLDNFIVNLLIILLASQLTLAKKRWGRYTVAAALGGIYACIAFGVDAAAMLPIRAAVGVAMGFIAFWVRGERGTVRCVCAFWAASFMLAGAVHAVAAAYGETATAGGVLIVRPPARAILLGLLTGAAVTAMLARISRRARQREPLTALMTLKMGSRRTETKAFIDTGNLVREPLTGLGVIFLSRTAAQMLLEPELMKLLEGRGTADTERLRVIPCSTAAGSRMLMGIEVDGAALKGAALWVRAVVCLANQPLMDGCGAIIGKTMMDELKKGAGHEDGDVGAQTGGMGDVAAEAGGMDGVYRRQRSAAPAAVTRGGGHTADTAGQGRQDGEALSD